MTTSKVGFYATGLFTVPTGFKRVSGPGATVGFEKQRAVGSDEYGDESGASLHSSEFRVSEVFESTSDTMTLPVSLGVLDNGVTLTGLKIETGLHKARLTMEGVYYTDADIAPSRKYTHAMTLTKGFGAVDFMAGTAGDAAHVASSSLSITCKPIADFDGDGVYNGHEVTEGAIEASVTWAGIPTIAAGAGWDVVSASPGTENKAFVKYDVTGRKAMTSAAVTP